MALSVSQVIMKNWKGTMFPSKQLIPFCADHVMWHQIMWHGFTPITLLFTVYTVLQTSVCRNHALKSPDSVKNLVLVNNTEIGIEPKISFRFHWNWQQTEIKRSELCKGFLNNPLDIFLQISVIFTVNLRETEHPAKI